MKNKRRKKTRTIWKSIIISGFILLIILGFLYFAKEAKLFIQDKDNKTEVQEKQFVECPTTLNLGQYCKDKENCCEEGTSCAYKWFSWDCSYNYPECPYPDMNISLEELNTTYELVTQELDIWEKTPLFVIILERNGHKIEIEQCMQNHEEFRDFCCRCPDGTSARFVYDEAQGLNYMWCFKNPN